MAKDEKTQSGWGASLSKLIGDGLNAYTQIEVAKATGGVATAPYQQHAALNAIPQYQNPQAKANEITATPGGAGGMPVWVWPLLIGGGVLGAVLLLRR